jgi:hypothetical protein
MTQGTSITNAVETITHRHLRRGGDDYEARSLDLGRR